MSVVAVGAAQRSVDVEKIGDGRWLLRCIDGDGSNEPTEGRVVLVGTVFQLRVSTDRRMRLYAPTFGHALDYFCSCVEGSMARVSCDRDDDVGVSGGGMPPNEFEWQAN